MINRNRVNRFYLNPFIVIVLSVILLLLPAFNNGYPLVWYDTYHYLFSGRNGVVPVNRPVIYGLFIKHISMSLSLWFVVITQAIIIGYLILMLAKFLWRDSWFTKSLLLILPISLLTAVSNFTSQIMPDIFTSVMILSLALFILYSDKSRIVTFIMAGLILFSMVSHFSNLLTSTILVFILVIVKLFLPKIRFTMKKILWLSIVVSSGWILIPTLNYIYGGGFNLSRVGNVFLTANLIETGIVTKFLDDNCKTKNITLCKYRNEFPMPAWYFLFRSSPLYDNKPIETLNTDSVWLQKNIEYAPMINDILTSPKYLTKIAGISFISTIKQLSELTIPEIPSRIEASNLFSLIETYYPKEANQCKVSKQSLSKQAFPVQSTLQMISVLISLIGILIIIILKKFQKYLSKDYVLILFIFISGIIINSWVCATFSSVATRYQSRVVWLIPFVFIIFVINIFYSKNNQVATP